MEGNKKQTMRNQIPYIFSNVLTSHRGKVPEFTYLRSPVLGSLAEIATQTCPWELD